MNKILFPLLWLGLIGTRDLFLFGVSDATNPKPLAAIKDRPRVDTINGVARLGDTVFANRVMTRGKFAYVGSSLGEAPRNDHTFPMRDSPNRLIKPTRRLLDVGRISEPAACMMDLKHARLKFRQIQRTATVWLVSSRPAVS